MSKYDVNWEKLRTDKLTIFPFSTAKENVTLHRTLMLKVIARSQHGSTLKQKNLVLARLKCVQEHTSLANSFVS